MDKNQPYFDPYNFNMQNNMQFMPGGIPQQIEMQPPLDAIQGAISPTMYYEQQYVYYRYLSQMLDYKMKLREYDNVTRNDKK